MNTVNADTANTPEKLINLSKRRSDFTDQQCAEYDFEIPAEITSYIDSKIFGWVMSAGYLKIIKKMLPYINFTKEDTYDICHRFGICVEYRPRLAKKIIKILREYLNIFMSSDDFCIPIHLIIDNLSLYKTDNNYEYFKKLLIQNYINLNLYTKITSYIQYYNFKKHKVNQIEYATSYTNIYLNFVCKYQQKYKYIFLCRNISRRQNNFAE